MLLDGGAFTLLLGALWGEAVAAALPGADADDAGVDGTGDTVLHFDVELGKSVFFIDRCLAEVTNRGGLDHVADKEALYGLVFWGAATTVGAANWVDVSPTLLGAPTVSSFLCHEGFLGWMKTVLGRYCYQGMGIGVCAIRMNPSSGMLTAESNTGDP